MRCLTLNEVLDLYQQVMEQSGGAVGIRDLNALESAVAQLHDLVRTTQRSWDCLCAIQGFGESLRIHNLKLRGQTPERLCSFR